MRASFMRYNTPYIKDGLSNTLSFDIRCKWRNDRVDIIAPSRMNDFLKRAYFFNSWHPSRCVFRHNAMHTASCRCESRFVYLTVRPPFSKYVLNILLHKPSRLRGRDLLVSKLQKNWQKFIGNCFLARERKKKRERGGGKREEVELAVAPKIMDYSCSEHTISRCTP